VRGGDRDHHGGLADADVADAMVDRDLVQVVPRLQHRRDARHHRLGHLGVGLVLEALDFAAAGTAPHRARERRDRAGALVGDLGDHLVEREGALGHEEGAARDGRDQRDLVAVPQGRVRLRVVPVERVEQPLRLLPQAEGGPDVGEAASRAELEHLLAGAGALTERGEQLHHHPHGAKGTHAVLCV
jgi:hypothetical protein